MREEESLYGGISRWQVADDESSTYKREGMTEVEGAAECNFRRVTQQVNVGTFCITYSILHTTLVPLGMQET